MAVAQFDPTKNYPIRPNGPRPGQFDPTQPPPDGIPGFGTGGNASGGNPILYDPFGSSGGGGNGGPPGGNGHGHDAQLPTQMPTTKADGMFDNGLPDLTTGRWQDAAVSAQQPPTASMASNMAQDQSGGTQDSRILNPGGAPPPNGSQQQNAAQDQQNMAGQQNRADDGGGDGGGNNDPNYPNPNSYQDLQRIHAFYQKYLGRDASDSEAYQWASGGMTWGMIENAIANSSEAKNKGNGGGNDGTNGNKGDLRGRLNAAMSQQDFIQWVTDAFAAQGKTAGQRDFDYWWSKWNEFGKGDPGTFYDKFMAPDTGGQGGGDNSGGGGGNYQQMDFGSGPIYDAIMRLLQRGEAPIDPNDPNISGPTNAYRAQAESSLRRNRMMLAERAAAEGMNSGGQGSGAFDSALQGSQEQEGRDIGSYQSGLIVQEIQSRRQDVVNALNFAQGAQRMQLQQLLSKLNLDLAYYQSKQQNNQFYDRLGFDIANQNNKNNDYSGYAQ